MRTYPIDGKDYPSVTTVLDVMDRGDGLKKWIAYVGWSESRRIFKESGERGTRVHEYIKSKILGVPAPTLDEGDTPYALSFDDLAGRLLSKYGILPDAERTVYCGTCGYAGTLDLAAKFGRVGRALHRRAVVDWKTTSEIRPEVGPQLAAYTHAYLVSALGLSCKKADKEAPSWERWAVKLDEDGEYELKRFRDYGGDMLCFRSLLNVYNWKLGL